MVNPFDPGCRRGDVIEVLLADVPQFTGPYHHIKLILSNTTVRLKYHNLHNQIHKVTDYRRLNLSPEEILPGINCIVLHKGLYRRAVVKKVLRVDVIKVSLIDLATTTVAHTSMIYSMDSQWNMFEHRVITCKLKQLSAFASSFHLRHILKDEIDWKGELRATVVKSGVIPTVICHSDTYPNCSLNQIILNYLYTAYDPKVLLRKHFYWPNSLITAEDHNKVTVSVQLNTALRDHVNKYLMLSNLTSNDKLHLIEDFKDDVVYLGLFDNSERFERLTLKVMWDRIIVTFIDTGRQITYHKDDPLRIVKTLPSYPAITSIPPLATDVKLNKVDTFKKGTFKNIIQVKVEVTVEIFKPPRYGSIPIVEIFEPLSSMYLNYNQILFEEMNPEAVEDEREEDLFRHKRKFSNLADWKLAFNGQNWGRDEERIFDLAVGTRFYGRVTEALSPSSFFVKPLDPVPLPKLVRDGHLLEFSCGCLWDGDFFRVKADTFDMKNVRVRLREPVILPEPLPHFRKLMEGISVEAYNVDNGRFMQVPVLHLRKMGLSTASVSPKVAFVMLIAPIEILGDSDEVAASLEGKTYKLEVLERQVDLENSVLMIVAKIICEVTDAIAVYRKSTIEEIEW